MKKATCYIKKLDSKFDLNDSNNDEKIKKLDDFMNSDDKEVIELNKPYSSQFNGVQKHFQSNLID